MQKRNVVISTAATNANKRTVFIGVSLSWDHYQRVCNVLKAKGMRISVGTRDISGEICILEPDVFGRLLGCSFWLIGRRERKGTSAPMRRGEPLVTFRESLR